jgi:hypothetical protein
MSKPTAVFRRPWLHHVIIFGYILAPFANILLMRLFLNVPLRVILSGLFAAYGVLATVWLVTAPVVGISLYFVSRFSWYLMLGHSSLILLDFVVKWAWRPAYYLRTVPGVQNLLLLGGNVALVVFIAFILQRDFRAPYFQVFRRGWRERKRVPMNLPVKLEGMARIVSDLSTSGCFVVEKGTNRVPGCRVRLSMTGHALKFDCMGEVMRTTGEGLGIRFHDLTAEEKRDISWMLKKRFALARKVELPSPRAASITES